LGWQGRVLAYKSHNAIRLQEIRQALQELQCEQVERLGAASEDIVHNIVKGMSALGDEVRRVLGGIRDRGRVVLLEVKVLGRELVNNGVNLNHGRVNPVLDKSTGGGTNSKTASDKVS
jgi:hypothetical protein